MRKETGFACITIIITAMLFIGCSSDGGGGTNPPVNQPPTVTITSSTPDSIYFNDSIEFTWQGDDSDGSIDKYFAGLDGVLIETTQTSAQYSGFNMGEDHTFSVYAVDNDGAESSEETVDFAVYPYAPEIQLLAYGEGVTDDDNDGYWTEFNVRWAPDVPTGSAVDLRLVVMIRPSYGSSAEIADSSDLITRNPGDEDTLTFTLPIISKDMYDLKVELHNVSGDNLQTIDYEAETSLTQIGLEQFDGFNAWFDDAWTDNAVDVNGDDYYESIEVWWDADASLDRGSVKVNIYERDSTGAERYLNEYWLYEVEGTGDQDAKSFNIIAGITFDDYDYRLVLLDEDDNLLDELDYGEDPDLMDIPLGNSGSLHTQTQAINTLK